MLAGLALEPLFVSVRTLRMFTHRTPLTRVFGVNPSCRNTLSGDTADVVGNRLQIRPFHVDSQSVAYPRFEDIGKLSVGVSR